MILGRIGIRGKLNLLLLLPLVAVLLVATPFLLGQVTNTRSASHTSDVAANARQLGGLTWELQRERLLTAAFLASPTATSFNLERQERAVGETVQNVRAALGPGAPDELTSALVRVGSLQELRSNALSRSASLDSVARTYHAVISAMIDAVRLVPQKTSDAEGTRQLTALEALLRANEESSLRGMALIVAAVSPQTGVNLLDTSVSQAQQFAEKFVQQADVEHAALLVDVEQGQDAKKLDVLSGALPRPGNTGAVERFVSDALGAAESQANLRRTVQDRVTTQISDAAAGRASDASRLAWTIGAGAALLFLLVAILAVLVSRSIANPLRRLTTAATNVADLADTELVRVSDTEQAEEQVPRLAAIDVASSDEIGKLAAAFNRVQYTAASLVERQAVTRRNVSLMFANVAQRTQNLVGRQLALVDELERNEQDERLLASLYKLDHLSTRLRRNADNLLVVAGTQDETKITGPSELTISLRSALAEIEDYQRVKLGNLAEILLSSSLGTDLVQVFAELLENATSFSPPDTSVEVESVFLQDGACMVNVIDHGIGMPAERMAEENRRVVERERLDIAPTSMLGLFVVGRLARRHGLYVDLVATEGGGITARVVVPPRLFTHLNQPEPVVEPPPPASTAAAAPSAEPSESYQRLPVPVMPSLTIPPAEYAEGFSWFAATIPARRQARGTPAPPIPIVVQPAAPPAAQRPVRPAAGPSAPPAAAADKTVIQPVAENGRTGLRRRVAGAQLPGVAAESQPTPPADRQPRHDPAAVRSALDGFQTAFAKAAELPTREQPVMPAPSQEPSGANAGNSGTTGLRRRVAGAQLPGATAAPPVAPRVERPQHDPAATRSAMDGFQTAFAKGASAPITQEPPPAPPVPAAAAGGHGGLSRRVPGESLAPGLRRQAQALRKKPPGSLPPRAARGWNARDPEAERSAFDAFSSGLARADNDPTKESQG
jgi:signal transduction histidine kinase